ncbi:hypothetical protein Lal_00014356 [Lupinus albus]|nr:hypothetical protein Lal_00014356 [Lupinus albus]
MFYRDRFGCSRSPSARYFKPSIWHGIRDNWVLANLNSIWLVGDGLQINFWRDNWIANVLDFIIAFKWLIPSSSSNSTSLSLEELVILKAFNISINLSKAPRIIKVSWQSPRLGWIKPMASLGNEVVKVFLGIIMVFFLLALQATFTYIKLYLQS